MKIYSPLTGSTNVVLEEEIQCSFLIENYKKRLDTDVRKYFEGLKTVQIYKCLDTSFRFYYPLNTIGDGEFYESLQKYSWYYMDWKWEHEITRKLIKSTDSILEIGCAQGGFLNKIQQKGIECVGLELNESAAEYRRSRGLQILNQSIQEHARENPEKYDVVCSFQVVEHIAAIKEFIQLSIDALKPSGKLIVSVPNNLSNSLILKNSILNMPPHHMGLWDAVSLANLQSLFPLRLERLEIEPIQKYHLGCYQSLLQNSLFRKFGFWYKIFKKISDSIMLNNLYALSNYLLGHTILAQYRKL